MSNHTTSLLRTIWRGLLDALYAAGNALCSLMEDDVDGGKRLPTDGEVKR